MYREWREVAIVSHRHWRRHRARSAFRLNFHGARDGTRAAVGRGVIASASLDAPIAGEPTGLATAHTATLVGLDAHPIRVEVCCTRGPSFLKLVGLAEAAVREARVRVASSLAGLGVLVNEYAVTINLAPADLRKAGAGLDLAIALGLLAAIGKLAPQSLHDTLLLGELSLDGALRPIRGVLPQLEGARARGVRHAIVPRDNAREAGLIRDVDVRHAGSLAEVLQALSGDTELPRVPPTDLAPALARQPAHFGDLADVRGQVTPRRSLEVAAAGHHNLLMIGPPGGGKTLLARLLPGILPPLAFDEAVQLTAIHSVAGLVDPAEGVVATRPFRAPHHSVSDAGLVGGGDVPRPGEVSLAHHGVLFLDELAEFRRSALETLRGPLEDGRVCIARARARAWFPARPLVVAAVNPCPCGYHGHATRECRCSPALRQRYLSRLSGPLLDRLDLHVAVPPVEVAELTSTARGETSAAVAARVAAARERQRERQREGLTAARTNAALSARELERVARCDRKTKARLTSAIERLGLSARAYVRVLRVARTIADLDQSDRVRDTHVAEAIQGRLLDRPVERRERNREQEPS